MPNWLPFIAVVAVFVIARFIVRHWVGRELRAGRISDRHASLVAAATWAAIPLLALPWAVDSWPLLLSLSAIGFLLYFAVFSWVLRFIRTGRI